MDSIAFNLNLNPLDTKMLSDIDKIVSSQEHSVKDTSPFHAEWFRPIMRENGRNSALVNIWNGSEQQKEFLRKAFKNRNIHWGEKITKAKSNGPYRIFVDGISYTTLSINKFAKEFNLNASSLRVSLRGNISTKTKGKLVQVVKL